MKPRIKWAQGIREWLCQSTEREPNGMWRLGWGHTPAEAYAKWLAWRAIP